MAEPTHDLDAVLGQAVAWRAAGHGVALATVVRTWGSSPRPPGSKLAVNDAGGFVGSVSGGCIEGAVITEALEVMHGGGPRLLRFGVSDASAWEVGLACGGKVEVLVEAIATCGPAAEADAAAAAGRAAVIAQVIAARGAHRPVALATWLDGRAPQILEPVEPVEPGEPAAGSSMLAEAAARALRRDQAEVVAAGASEALIEPHAPPLRLILVGAVHIAQPLAEMAGLAGFAVTIVDPRRAWATAARFPGKALVTEWPDVALAALAPDARTAVVTITHDPKLDDPALIAALRSPAFYVGCLGSQQTHAARRARLDGQGLNLERLRGPVGLRIGARSPAEIAVSVLAEIIATLRGAP
jgi:xanthine dehydrogenase accessory factor